MSTSRGIDSLEGLPLKSGVTTSHALPLVVIRTHTRLNKITTNKQTSLNNQTNKQTNNFDYYS